MKKINVVKNSRDFDRIIKYGKMVKNKCFVIYYDQNNLDFYRFGISVGKKIGNAVTRNYYKRVMRNVCDNYKNYYSKGRDYIIIVRKACTLLSFSEMEDSFVYLINKIEKEKKNEEKF